VLLLVAGAGYYYFIFFKTPTYVFMQIEKAYDTYDVELFKKYVMSDKSW